MRMQPTLDMRLILGVTDAANIVLTPVDSQLLSLRPHPRTGGRRPALPDPPVNAATPLTGVMPWAATRY
jgi:hypothetical protein